MSDEQLSEVAQELRKICLESPQKRLEPRKVVEVARDESHPLHKHFEWDDSVAAEQYRLDQARELIHSVHINITYEDRVVRAPYYVRDQRVDADEQGYAPIEIFRKKDLAESVLRREVSRVETSLDRALGAAVALGIEKEFKRATKRIVPQLQKLVESLPQLT